MPRRLISIISLILLLFSLAATSAPLPIPKPPATGARAFIIQDFHSDRVVAEEASDQPCLLYTSDAADDAMNV